MMANVFSFLAGRYAYTLAGWHVGLAVTLTCQNLNCTAYFWVPLVAAVLLPVPITLVAKSLRAGERSGVWWKTLAWCVLFPLVACFVFHCINFRPFETARKAASAPALHSTERPFGIDPPGAVPSSDTPYREQLSFVVAVVKAFVVFVLRIALSAPSFLNAMFVLACVWPLLRRRESGAELP